MEVPAPMSYEPKTSIVDLPEKIQNELSHVVKIVRKSKLGVLMVWLFRSYARGEDIVEKPK